MKNGFIGEYLEAVPSAGGLSGSAGACELERRAVSQVKNKFKNKLMSPSSKLEL
jgi:hypothetical protein